MEMWHVGKWSVGTGDGLGLDMGILEVLSVGGP